jgi:hypothetical protein
VATVIEKFASRPSTVGDGAQVDLAYIISDTDDDLAVKAALLAGSPTVYDGLVRQSAHIEPIGPGLWEGTVRYAPFVYQPPQTGESSFTFDTGGGTQHITQSLQTVGKYPAASAPDFAGAIGVTHDNVEGVDITIPVYQFSETHYLAPTLVTPAYQGTLFALTGKVNNAPFRACDTGECLFLGASGSRRGTSLDADWEITFRFAGSPNVTGLTIGTITGINKKGWEYMWVRYADSEDATAKVLVKKPVAIYIEKVYELGNFSLLGIGT